MPYQPNRSHHKLQEKRVWNNCSARCRIWRSERRRRNIDVKNLDPEKRYEFKINGYVDSYQHMEPISVNGTLSEVKKKAKEKFDELKNKNPKENYWMSIHIKDKNSKYGFSELFDERVKK